MKLNEFKPIVGQVIDIAEHATYLELTSRVCYYNEPNLNNDMLPYDENSETIASTLVNMPVQARYRTSPNGNATFGSHEMKKSRDGTVTFGTVSIGTHVETWIANDNVTINDGTIKELPCLFAKYRLWKRYPKMIAAAQRLYSEGKLYSSWEINTYQYVYDRGIRKVTDYEFLSNCLLGYEYAYPSYGTSANAISMAELNDNPELMIAEALSQDLIDNKENKEVNLGMAKKNEKTIAEDVTDVTTPADTDMEAATAEETEEKAEQTTDTATAEETVTKVDSAQLTVDDLRQKVRKACADKLDKWCYIALMFPNEKEVWCEYDGAETQLDFVKFTYEVDENDIVTVSEPEYVKLTVSVAEINDKIASLEKEVDTVRAELDLKNDAITKASEKIQNLNVQISELTPYKEQVETAEKERIEAEITAEKEGLKAKLLKGGFTEDEIAEQNIAELIEARDISAIKGLIADKFLASFDVEENSETGASAETSVAEVATASLEADDEDTDIRSFMSKVLS